MSVESGTLPPLDEWPRPVAFALSGGGAWGASQVGMLRTLGAAGIVPDMIVGTSVGALNGALLAVDHAAAADVLTDVWLQMDRSTIFGTSRGGALVNLVRSRGASLAKPDGLRRLIAGHCPIGRIEDLSIPFTAVATELLSGEIRLLDHGRLMTALLASAAIPGVFPPVEVGGAVCVDGGVCANIPVRPTLRRGAGTVVVLDATPETLSTRPPDRPVGRALHTAGLMLRSQAAADVEGIDSNRLIVRIPKATPPGVSSFDFEYTAELIARGEKAVDDALTGLRRDTGAV